MRFIKKMTIFLLIAGLVAAGIFYAKQKGSVLIAEFILKDIVRDELTDMLDDGTLTMQELHEAFIRSQNKKDNSDKPKEPHSEKDTDNPPSNEDTSSDEIPFDDFLLSETETREALDQRANEIAGLISDKDKKNITSLILSKLSAEDISYLLGLLEGGLTTEEKREAKAIAYAKFNDEEIKEIKGYYRQYLETIK